MEEKGEQCGWGWGWGWQEFFVRVETSWIAWDSGVGGHILVEDWESAGKIYWTPIPWVRESFVPSFPMARRLGSLGSAPFFHHVGPWFCRAVKLGRKPLYLLRHLDGPELKPLG